MSMNVEDMYDLYVSTSEKMNLSKCLSGRMSVSM